jgi:outer membrane protein assembly factor BamB
MRFHLWLLAALVACGVAQTPWPKFRHDLQQTGRSPFGTNAGAGLRRWSFSTGASVRSSAAVGDNGVLYVGSEDGHLYALNGNDGSLRWKLAMGGPVSSSPIIRGDGTLFVGCGDGNLYAVRSTGSVLWKLPLLGEVAAARNLTTPLPIVSSPTIGADDVVYVGSQDTNLFAVNPTGTLRWKFRAGGSVESSPALANDGTLYFGSVDHNLYAVDAGGMVKWSVPTGDQIQSSPALGADGTVYVTSNDFHLYAVDPAGSVKWKVRNGVTGALASSPAVATDGTIYVAAFDGRLAAHRPADGTIRWTTTLGPVSGSAPAIGGDGTIYVGSTDHSVYAVKSDGTLSWKLPTGGSVVASPAIASDGTVYVGATSGEVNALGTIVPPTGTRLRLISSPPVGTCGAARRGGPGGTIVKTLGCGWIDFGGGQSTFVGAPVPNGAVTELNTACTRAACTVTARTAAETGSNDTCSAAGCRFGPYIPVANAGTSACLRNSFAAAASGTLDSALGTFTGSFPLSSAVYLTANAASPCPRCVGGTVGTTNSGTCDPTWRAGGPGPFLDAGTPCTPINAARDTHDCEPPTATLLSAVPLALTPLTTGSTSLTGPGGLFCPTQTTPGAFGCSGSNPFNPTCPGGNVAPVVDYIGATGKAAGALTPGAHPITLASIFCVPTVGGTPGHLIDAAANLPGPGAVSLPATIELLP